LIKPNALHSCNGGPLALRVAAGFFVASSALDGLFKTTIFLTAPRPGGNGFAAAACAAAVNLSTLLLLLLLLLLLDGLPFSAGAAGASPRKADIETEPGKQERNGAAMAAGGSAFKPNALANGNPPSESVLT
jgi:hypothetical protein